MLKVRNWKSKVGMMMEKKGGKQGWELHDSTQESGGKPPPDPG